MSYKKDMIFFAKGMKERRDTLFFAVKGTTLLLGLSLLVLIISIIVTSIGGNGDGKTVTSKDKTPPVITVNGDDVIYGIKGKAVSYLDKVTFSDDSGKFTYSVDNSGVDTQKEGRYTVTYHVTDEAGNKTSLSLPVIITEAEYSYESLMVKIGRKANELGITKDMSVEDKIKAIFKYTNSPHLNKNQANIIFVEKSNITPIDRNNWKNDWIKEAHLTLENGQGDCYSYFSVSKAFFTYFGIEHLDVKQSQKPDGSTHFWSMVNIGDTNTPKWYFYDSTRLSKAFSSGSGCLFTEAQLSDYNTIISPGFYDFDNSGYPNTSANVINDNYTW